MFGMSFNPFKSKAIWGAVAVAASIVLTALGTEGGVNADTWAAAIGVILAALGLRDAATKPDQEGTNPVDEK
jgi:hypothetical protein